MDKSIIKEKTKVIDQWLDKYLEVKDNPQRIIYEAMRYSVFAGGKRLRPILMMSVCEMCGTDPDEVMPFACAMEMIHTYSLIHDDLPAMDNDDLRRGMPTNHIKYGEAVAVLAGDALLNKAFEIVTDHEWSDMRRAMKAVNILASSSGSEGMIGGQVIDILNEGKDIAPDLLRCLHMGKTGAIIRSSCVIGALIGGAKEIEIKAADEFAVNLGMAFQIRDDILDVTGSEEELGKPIGSDEREGKNTYVKLLGLDKAREMSELYSDKAKAALDIFGEKADFLRELTDYLTERNK